MEVFDFTDIAGIVMVLVYVYVTVRMLVDTWRDR